MTLCQKTDRILILDFGSQYTQLIARCVRVAGVYSEIHPYDMPFTDIKALAPKGILLSGGPESATQKSVGYHNSKQIYELGIPILGICYGMQIMVAQLGGSVISSTLREFGAAQIRARNHSTLLKNIQDETNADGNSLLNVWMSHGDRVETLPSGFKIIATTDNAPIAGIADEERKLYGLQFHPEVTQTTQGKAILKRFLYDIVGCRAQWSSKNISTNLINKIINQVGKDKVLLALSGGVDSSVVAVLLHRAIGEQLTCIFVDNGLLRLNEAQQVMDTFSQQRGINVIYTDASAVFLKRLQGVTDPEQKRKIIGSEFINVFEKQAQDFDAATWLAQGTIYSDVIESAAAGKNKAHVIKSHHNVGGLPAAMKMQLLEPVRTLFKDEVRALGLELGLPKAMINRHPFPGPGLAVRVLGEVKKEYLELLRLADNILIEELHSNDLYDEVSQAFAVFLPIRSVGVKGDSRCYDYVISLRVVVTTDFMTAQCAHLPYPFLEKVSVRILNEVDGISRVTYDISSKPPATIEWE